MLNKDILEKLIKGLKEIIFESQENNIKDIALRLFVEIKNITYKEDVIIIKNVTIPALVYQDTVAFIRDEKKIQAIKEIKTATSLGLRESKELVEAISFIEQIPMINGYHKY